MAFTNPSIVDKTKWDKCIRICVCVYIASSSSSSFSFSFSFLFVCVIIYLIYSTKNKRTPIFSSHLNSTYIHTHGTGIQRIHKTTRSHSLWYAYQITYLKSTLVCLLVLNGFWIECPLYFPHRASTRFIFYFSLLFFFLLVKYILSICFYIIYLNTTILLLLTH